eukprot:1285319-Prymnesium_polylepis.1
MQELQARGVRRGRIDLGHVAAARALGRRDLLPLVVALALDLLRQRRREHRLAAECVEVDLRLGHAVEAIGAPAT